MLKRTDSLPYVYSSISTTEFTTERAETIRVDTINVFNNDGVLVSFHNMITNNYCECITELPTILKRRGTVDFSCDSIQIVPSANEDGKTHKVGGNLVYAIYIPESVANLEYGTCAELNTYGAYIHTMYFVLDGNIHSCYIVNENLGKKLSEYHSYFKDPFIRDGEAINELVEKAQEYKAEYERVKALCDSFEQKHTENVVINSYGHISYKNK